MFAVHCIHGHQISKYLHRYILPLKDTIDFSYMNVNWIPEEWGLVVYQHLCRKSFSQGYYGIICDYIIYVVTLFNAT